MKIQFLLITLAAFAAAQLNAADTDAAANAINALGIDLLAKTGKPDANALLSPYSIQEALAMTYAGAAGETREEMAAALHFPKHDVELVISFHALELELVDIQRRTRRDVADSKDAGPNEPVTLSVANRLYGQKGYDFSTEFLAIVREGYGAPLEQVDFKKAPDSARKAINAWVEERTRRRIQNLIPEGALDSTARLVLVNAIYFKAAWDDEFKKYATRPAPFHVNGGNPKDVPMMNKQADYSYAKKNGYTAVALPYIGENLQFLVLLPDKMDGLAALEAKLTPSILADCANLDSDLVNLSLPKFKMEPEGMELNKQLESLGMKTAFDVPTGSADFSAMAPRKPNNYLYISGVFHKAFISIDEHGTEAAAATAVIPKVGSAMNAVPQKPKVVHIDHPFLFAIQDRKSGACLFLGRVTDPR